jgi:V/A-type H+/Na+-transporting ATPase subunit D
MREVSPTRNAAIELADERRLMRQGYAFLDEKRMLLASELLRRLRLYQENADALDVDLKTASAALAAAVERHGLEHLQLYPVPSDPPFALERARSVFLGVPVVETRPSAAPERPVPPAIDPSPEAQACRAAFERVLRSAVTLGARAGNLRRLAREYRRTERRANALDNVLVPEIEQALASVDEQLDALEREEAVRARWSGQRRDVG